MTHTPSSPILPRRLFLGSLGAVGASAALAACGGGSTPPGAAPTSGAFGKGDTYTGPKVALAFWNGFTGGDGPFMKKMVEDFNKANPNVTVSMNTLQWADYYAKVPNAVASGAGPDVGIMHIDSAGDERGPPGHRAARRDRLRTGARGGRLRPSGMDRPASTRTSATASRWTSTRWASTGTPPTWRRPASPSCPRTAKVSRPP